MNFASEIFGNRQTLLWFLDYHIEQRLRPYQEALDWFLSDLFRAVLPWDWRQGWHAFVADQAIQGRITEPQSVREMEVWIEGWAGFCGLLPRTAAADPRSEELPGSVYIPLPPGLPMRERIAAARARDALARERRHELYEERNRQVLEARRVARRSPPRRKTPQPGKEWFFNRNLAIAQNHLDEIERLLQALGNKLDAAKVDEQVDVEIEADAIETLIWSYNDSLESAQATWLRDDLSRDANTRLNQMSTPTTFGLPHFTDQLQADRAQKQQLEISRRSSGRDVTISRVIVGMQAIETATTLAGIAAGGGVVVVAAKKGGKWAVVKTIAAIGAGMAADEVAERVAGAAGLNEQTIRGIQLAAAVIKLILLRRGSRTDPADPVARAAPDDGGGASRPRVSPSDTASGRARVEQPRDARGRFLPKSGGEARPGSQAEELTWDAIKQKPGWQVTERPVTVRDATGQLRVYDGAAISPKGRVIGLETKSGTGRLTPKQREFDRRLNSSPTNKAIGVGKSREFTISRAIEVRQ